MQQETGVSQTLLKNYTDCKPSAYGFHLYCDKKNSSFCLTKLSRYDDRHWGSWRVKFSWLSLRNPQAIASAKQYF